MRIIRALAVALVLCGLITPIGLKSQSVVRRPIASASSNGLQFDHIGSSLSGSDGSDISFWSDSSPSGNNLTNSESTKSPIVKTAFLNGLPVSQFGTKGTAEYLLLDSDVSLQTFTFIAVMRCTLDTSSTPRTLIGLGASTRGGASSGGPQIRIYQNKINLLRQGVADIGSSSTTLSTSNFYTIAVTYSSPNAAFYLNGSADGTASSAQTFTLPFRTIGVGNGGENFVGYIGEPKLWDRVLSGAELTAEFDALRTRWGHY